MMYSRVRLVVFLCVVVVAGCDLLLSERDDTIEATYDLVRIDPRPYLESYAPEEKRNGIIPTVIAAGILPLHGAGFPVRWIVLKEAELRFERTGQFAYVYRQELYQNEVFQEDCEGKVSGTYSIAGDEVVLEALELELQGSGVTTDTLRLSGLPVHSCLGSGGPQLSGAVWSRRKP